MLNKEDILPIHTNSLKLFKILLESCKTYPQIHNLLKPNTKPLNFPEGKLLTFQQLHLSTTLCVSKSSIFKGRNTGMVFAVFASAKSKAIYKNTASQACSDPKIYPIFSQPFKSFDYGYLNYTCGKKQ